MNISDGSVSADVEFTNHEDGTWSFKLTFEDDPVGSPLNLCGSAGLSSPHVSAWNSWASFSGLPDAESCLKWDRAAKPPPVADLRKLLHLVRDSGLRPQRLCSP